MVKYLLQDITNNKYLELDKPEVLSQFKRDVPNFYDKGECDEFYVPVKDGEIRVFHHKPSKVKTQRPIIFIPGFATTPFSWREYHHSHHYYAEYFHIETRDKKSSRINNHKNVDFTIKQIAEDINDVLHHLGLENKDYVLMGACMCGGMILTGLIHKILNPPTAVVLDPFTKWKQNKLLVKTVMPIIPSAVLGGLKSIFAKVILANMKNEAQKQRNLATVEGAVPWIWKKFSTQNLNYDLTNDLEKIDQEVFLFHGPPDKYHPEGFEEVAKRIPNSRYVHIPVQNEYRELLAGIIGAAFAMGNKKSGLPEIFKQFEVFLD